MSTGVAPHPAGPDAKGDAISTHDPPRELATESGFDINAATREALVAHIDALEGLYRAHPAQQALEELHGYLFPERYAPVTVYQWHAGTIEDVTQRIERALPDAPTAPATPSRHRSRR